MSIALKVPPARPPVAAPAAAAADAPPLKLVPAAPPLVPARAKDQTAAIPRPVDTVSRFIDLEIEARRCGDLDALRFAIVNSTRRLAPYDQAFLVEPSAGGKWAVTRAASVAKVDRHAPLVRAVEAWLSHPSHADTLRRGEHRTVEIAEECSGWGLDGKVFLHPEALWLPIKSREGQLLAGLLALRTGKWMPQHCALLMPLAGAYGHAWAALSPTRRGVLSNTLARVGKARLGLSVAALATICAFLPVPLSALAPAEIVARDPLLVTAPIEGVVGDILVSPGAWVETGTPLIRFVDVKLRSDLEIAARNKAVASARYFKVVQAATATQKDMQDLATAKAELDLATAEHSYASDLLARAEVRAERSGYLIYAAKSDWIGKPVAIGERMMEIGDPARSEIRIELPVSDAIAVREGGGVSLFLDGDPLSSIAGTVTRASYRPSLTAEQQLAYRIHARIDDGQPRRIGLRGVARIKGETVSLWLYLLRRPFSTIRQKLGL